jgi:hypothetical protein
MSPPESAIAPRKTKWDDEEAPSVRVASRVPIPERRSDQGHGGAARTCGRQQPRRGRAAERHLRALAEAEALARAAADHPESAT